MLRKAIFEDTEVDDHIFTVVYCKDRPTVSLDIDNVHGRRFLSVRVDGMGVGGFLVDIDSDIGPLHSDKRLKRFCAYCGAEFNLISSKTHTCKEE